MRCARRSSGNWAGLSIAATFFLLGNGAPALAQKAPPPNAVDCDNAGTNPEMVECQSRELVAADAALNAAYKQAFDEIKKATHLNTNQRRDWERALRESQRNWLAYRERDCGEVIGWEWYQGSGMRVASLACKSVKTRARAEELTARYGQPK